ncbi:alpha-amylase [Haladaptatus sp. R4]|uniref:alpha-amylase family glycosyl hydrolase n=1 Tax=Haladaptatus sp. R4 TaxID=1679489 RepID=UPI0007B4EA9A|nr:alpha-amylase family glycosyl hydrolase [Haladaptatus sp. R4]KZN26163.1 alpha-amylase [Haladaptatus sp. R4]
MHTADPPRFTTVGAAVELAPHDPNPNGEYEWHLETRPDGSSAVVDDAPVVHFAPDVPGVYRLRLSAPDGDHERTVRAFPDERRPARFELPLSDLPIPHEELESVCIAGPFNEHLVGRDRPTYENGAYVYETELPPGEHPYGFLLNDDLTEQVQGTLTVPGPGRPRIHLDATVETDSVVVTATTESAPDSEFADDELTVELYENGSRAVTDGPRTVRIPRNDIGDGLRIHAVAVGERHSIADCVEIGGKSELGLSERSGSERSEVPRSEGVGIHRPNDPPEWAESATVYEIFVRSFAGETVDTTFEELERRLPYLEWLGVDCVWLTPILGSPTDHGYHTTNYFETAEDLGTRGEFESFVSACHDAGIRVVFDLVINHSSRDHPAFQMSAAGVPEYRDWYIWEEDEETGEPKAQRYFNWDRIPNYNFDSLAVRRFLLDVVDEWAGVVDGFRCDVAWGVPHEFWKELAARVPDDFLLLDETIPRDPAYHEGEFTITTTRRCTGTLRKIGNGEKPASAVFDALSDAERAGFPESAVHLRYVENHDESRYLDDCDRDALKAAAAATFTLPGAPMIYYGQERGMTEYRGTMRWDDGDDELTAFHRSLVEVRNEHPVLEGGTVEGIEWESESSSVVAFARDDGESRVVVALNFADGSETVRIGERVEDVNLVSGERVPTATGRDSKVELSVSDVVVVRTTEESK